jgi:hypothetical protein
MVTLGLLPFSACCLIKPAVTAIYHTAMLQNHLQSIYHIKEEASYKWTLHILFRSQTGSATVTERNALRINGYTGEFGMDTLQTQMQTKGGTLRCSK